MPSFDEISHPVLEKYIFLKSYQYNFLLIFLVISGENVVLNLTNLIFNLLQGNVHHHIEYSYM